MSLIVGKKRASRLIVLCFLSWTNSRAAARAVRRLEPQTTCRRFHPTCLAQGAAAPQATTHCIQLLLEERETERCQEPLFCVFCAEITGTPYSIRDLSSTSRYGAPRTPRAQAHPGVGPAGGEGRRFPVTFFRVEWKNKREHPHKEEKESGLIVLYFLNWTDSRAAA